MSIAMRPISGRSMYGWGMGGSGQIAGGGKYTKALWQSGKDMFRRGIRNVQAAVNDPKHRRMLAEWADRNLDRAKIGITKMIEEKGMPAPKLAVVEKPVEEKTGSGLTKADIQAWAKTQKMKGRGAPARAQVATTAVSKPKLSAGKIAKMRMAQLQL